MTVSPGHLDGLLGTTYTENQFIRLSVSSISAATPYDYGTGIYTSPRLQSVSANTGGPYLSANGDYSYKVIAVDDSANQVTLATYSTIDSKIYFDGQTTYYVDGYSATNTGQSYLLSLSSSKELAQNSSSPSAIDGFSFELTTNGPAVGSGIVFNAVPQVPLFLVDDLLTAYQAGTLTAGSMANVADSSAHVAAHLDALRAVAAAGQLNMISLLDQGTPILSVTAAQLSADSAVLGDISGKFSLNVTGVSVLQAQSISMAPHVVSISVSDTASGVDLELGVLNGLASAGELSSISLTDQGTLELLPYELSFDAAALKKLTGVFVVEISGAFANLAITGVTGHESVLFAGARGEYSITTDTDGKSILVTDIGTGRSSVDHFTNISSLVFSDSTYIVAAAGGDTTIAKLYQSTFGRTPDLSGLAAWESQFDSGAMSLAQISQAFAGSQEFQSRYGANTSDLQYVDALYSNVLGRGADKAGEAAWVDFLGSDAATLGGSAARADVLLRFALSAEEVTNSSSWLISPGATAQSDIAGHVQSLVGTVANAHIAILS